MVSHARVAPVFQFCPKFLAKLRVCVAAQEQLVEPASVIVVIKMEHYVWQENWKLYIGRSLGLVGSNFFFSMRPQLPPCDAAVA